MFQLQDNKADLVINYYVDDVLEKVMSFLSIDTPTYNDSDDPTKLAEYTIIDWTIHRHDVLALEKIFKSKCKGLKKKRSLIKNKSNNGEFKNQVDDKSKMIKLEIKEELNSINGSSKSCIANIATHNNANAEESTNNANVIRVINKTVCTEIITSNEDKTGPDNINTNSEDCIIKSKVKVECSDQDCSIKSEVKVESSDQDKINTTEQMSNNDVTNVNYEIK